MIKKKILFILLLISYLLLTHVTNSHALGINDNCTATPTACDPPLSCLPVTVGNPISTCQASGNIIPGQGADIGGAFGQNFRLVAPRSFGGFVSAILPQLYTIAIILVLIYIVWGSYRYMISGGDPKAVQAAKGHLTWAVAGMIIIFLSYGLFQLLNSFLNNIY